MDCTALAYIEQRWAKLLEKSNSNETLNYETLSDESFQKIQPMKR
jgi:hypothetical protein